MSNLHKPQNYRPDIDGLRAFAVLSVLFYHISPSHLGGGFIGVDIFFVISGYLISSIIFKSIENNSFSFLDFYARRVRRIFPALLFCLVVCLLAGWFILIPEEYKQLGWHVFGGSTYISNFILWFESGYFDTSSVYKPLLHLWSLGIEEQFYLLWPLLLIVCYRIKLNPLFICTTLILFSFVLAYYEINHDSTAAFYSPQTRFWELASGSLLAYIKLRYSKNIYNTSYTDKILNKIIFKNYQVNHITLHLLSIVSFIVMMVSIWYFTEENFPSFKTFIPIIASIVIIYCGQNAIINKYILSNRFVVWIGLISYPLYIWHWPITSFCWIIEAGKPAPYVRFWCVVLSFVMAWMTFRFVEPRLRYGQKGNLKAFILFLCVVLVGLLGLFVHYKNGFSYRSYTPTDHYVGKIWKASKANCLKIFPDWEKLNNNISRLEKPEGNNQIAVIGDSHAAHLFPGLVSSDSIDKGIALFPASCAAPYLDISVATRGKMTGATRERRKNGWKLINRAYDYIVAHDEIDTVILGHYPGCSYGDIIDLKNPNLKDRNVILENGMRRTFDLLKKHNKTVIVVLDNPFLPFDPKRCVPRPFRFSNSNCTFEKKHHETDKKTLWYKNILEKVIKDYPNIKIVDSASAFCDDKYCYAYKNGKLLYSDKGHLNTNGSMLVAPLIEELIIDKKL